MKRVLVACAGVLVFAAGCSSSGSGSGSSSSAASGSGAGSGSTSASASQSGSSAKLTGSINVYAAASLTEAFNTIKSQLEAANPGITITIKYGPSSGLETMINNGAAADVFASASTKNMTGTKGAQNPTNFVTNTAEIAVPPKNPGKITKVQDLARSGVKVAVCQAAVPCGVVAAQVFKNAKITVKPKAQLADVKTTLAAVESGEVDAGVVYVTDVRAAGSKVKGVLIPDSVNASTEYPIATLKDAKNATLAKAFVDYVLSDAGKKVLLADGFKAP